MYRTIVFIMCCVSYIMMVNSHPLGHKLRGRQFKYRGKRNNGWHKSTTKSNSASCSENFAQYVRDCMDPFSKKVHLYTEIQPEDPFVQKIFIGHACRQYKKMLLCIHTSLTNCPTTSNMEIVQEQLGQAWVTKVNTMCNIQSNSSSQTNHGRRGKLHNSTSLAEPRNREMSTVTDSNNSRNCKNQSSSSHSDTKHNSDRLNSAKQSDDTISQTLQKHSNNVREISRIPVKFLQFRDKEPDLVILYGPEIKHSSLKPVPTKISDSFQSYSEPHTNTKQQPSLLKWLYIAINASNLKSVQVGISSLDNGSDGVTGRELPPLKYAQKSGARTVYIHNLYGTQILLISAVIYMKYMHC